MSETPRDTGIDATPDTLLEIVPHILAEWGQRTAAIVCRHVSAWQADLAHIEALASAVVADAERAELHGYEGPSSMTIDMAHAALAAHRPEVLSGEEKA
jgi:hypothetical protein